jgi:hypothetical protein
MRACFVRTGNPMTLRSVVRYVLQTLLILVLLMAAALACFTLWLRGEHGRAFAAEKIGKFVSANIPGRLVVTSISRFDLDTVVASDVKFFHPNGTLILFCKHAEVVPDLGMALRGRLGFGRAVCDGGFLLLTSDPDGRLGIEATMNAARPPGVPDDDPYGGLNYHLRSMFVEHFTIVCHIIKLKSLNLRETRGLVTIRRIATQGVQVKLEGISGKVAEELAGEHFELERVDGWIHGKERQVAHFDANTKVGSASKLNLTIDYFDRPKKPVKIRVRKKEGVAATGMALLLHATDLLSGAVDVSDSD